MDEPVDNDLTLLVAWRDAGDRSAGMALFDRYYPALTRFFHNKVDESASADLVQNTFLACVEGKERFRGDGSFRSYLFAIACNLLRKYYGTKKRHPGPIDFSVTRAVDLAPSITEVIRVKEEQRLMLAALRRLPIECQEVLELHYWEQMTVTEIATIVAVPAGTVKSRLQRGRRLLKAQLRKLATSRAVLESTLSNLDDWARGLRDHGTSGAATDLSNRWPS